ncbi:hypothetical protein EB796_022029 [Bugula neritina]|uniref:Uncharacterized protein n=1 Tax=Bugula neritina TaxID=10212 RepID=A0A7J7J1Q1_BUGNE|nr:hypothetical protein EB796_022029 [Bugula neritina]
MLQDGFGIRENIPVEYDDLHIRLDCLMDAISEEEVAKYLFRKSKGAPGPNGQTWMMLKDVKMPISTFNL